MTRTFAALGSSLALAFALTAAGPASAWEGDGYPPDDKGKPEEPCPAKNKWECKDEGGTFYKNKYKKVCIVPGDVEKAKCDYGYKAKVQTSTEWTYYKYKDKCRSEEGDLEVIKCYNPWGYKVDVEKCTNCEVVDYDGGHHDGGHHDGGHDDGGKDYK